MTALPVEKTSRFRNWQPKTWQPVYEQMVALSAIGLSNVSIAERFGYTKEHVSNVLSTQQAKTILAMIVLNLRKNVERSIPMQLEEIAHKAVERIQSVMNDDDLFEKSPFAVIDRGIAVLKGTSHLKSENSSGLNIDKAVVLNKESAEAIVRSLEQSREAQRLIGIDVTPSK